MTQPDPDDAQNADAQATFSGTREVDPRYALDEAALDRWLTAHVEGYGGPLTVRQFKGGQSNPTYELVTPGHAYVLRRKPPGTLLPSAHAVDREFTVITPSLSFKLPNMKHGGTVAWFTSDGRLTPNKPNQGNLFGTIREITTEPRVVRG